MRRSRWLMCMVLAALPLVVACTKGNECDDCSQDSDCKGGLVCVNFLDEKETNLSDRVRGEFGKPNPKAGGLLTESGPEADPLFWSLLAIAGIAMLANWCWALRSEPVSQRSQA